MTSATPRFLVTGAFGCIGSWVIGELRERNLPAVMLDSGRDPHRLRLLLPVAAVDEIQCERVDIADLSALEGVLERHGITHVIHLAALQVPFCRADPHAGALVNVVGTVNVFEAVKRRGSAMAHVVYASSVAAYDAFEGGELGPQMVGTPGTLYGVFKRCNEGTAEVYFHENQVSSIGLRPHTVYGLGRDQGLTSAPTTAMLAAAAGVDYHIPYGGAAQLQFTRDVARAFVAASLAPYQGASVHNLPGRRVSMAEVVEAIAAAAPSSAGRISFSPQALPFPEEVDAGSLQGVVGELIETPLQEGVSETIAEFQRLLAEGRLSAPAAAR